MAKHDKYSNGKVRWSQNGPIAIPDTSKGNDDGCGKSLLSLLFLAVSVVSLISQYV